MSPVEFVLSTFGRARLVGVVLVLLALVFFGAGFVFFMVDDGVLLALGDLFLLPGTWLLLGPTRLLSLARRAGPRGLGAFALGVCLVFAGWAASGLVVQVVGALELFGPTVPALLKTLRLIPGVGHVLALPPVAALLDALSVVSGGLSPNATYAMFALALAAGVPRLLGAGGGVGDAGSDPAAASAAAAAAAAAARKAAADAMDGGSAGSAAAEAAADAAAKAAATAAAAAAAAAGGPSTAAWLLPLLVALAMAAGAVWCFTKESRSGSDVAAKGAAGSDAEAAGAESEAAVRAAAKAEAAADAVLLEAARKAVDAEEEEEEEEGEEGKAATTTAAASTDAQQFLKNKTGLLFGAVSSVSTGLLGALGVSKGDGGGGGAAAAAAAAAEEHVGDDDDDDDDGEAGGEDEDEAKEAGEEAGEGGAHVAIGSAEDDGMAWLGACDWVTMDSADVEAEIALLRHQGADGVGGVGVGGDDASAPGAAGAALHEEEDDARAADDAAAAKAVVERLSKPPPAGGFTLAESLRFEGVLRRCREEGSSDAAAQKAAELLPTFALLRWGAALTRAARENAQVRRAQLLGGIAQAATLCSPEQRQHHPESKAAASFPWLRDLRATLVNEGHTAAASACALADAEALIIEDARSAAAALGLDALAPPHWASPAVWTSGGCGDDVGGAAAEAAAVNLRAASTAEALEQALLAHCGAAEGAAEEGVVVGEDDDGEEDDGDEKKDATPSSGGATGGLLVPLQWLQPPRNAQAATDASADTAEVTFGADGGLTPKQLHQDSKDIGRDEVEVLVRWASPGGGAPAEQRALLSGAALGYEGVVDVLEAAMCGVLREAQVGAGSAEGGADNADCASAATGDGGVLRGFARRVLTQCNRTCSGGAAMDAFERLGIDRQRSGRGMDDDGDGTADVIALVVPDSAAAPPLRITIDTGPFQLATRGSDGTNAGAWSWGVRAAVEASTLFTLMEPNPSDEESGRWANLRASFRTSFALPRGCTAAAAHDRLAREPMGAVLITASKRK